MTTNGNEMNGNGATFNEAPASLNLRFDYNGFRGIQLTLRASTGKEVLTKLDGAMAALDKMGAMPAGGNTSVSANGNAPTCPTHGNGKGKPMAESNKWPGYYCPNKNDDGSYCKFTVKK